jgi:uncharacterized protein (TIGR02231 family)
MTILRFVLATSIALAGASAASAESIDANSSISNVTVYTDRAIVTRSAQLDLEAGTQEIRFPGLPATLDPDLLQVSGSGSADAAILEVRATPEQLQAASNPRLQELLDQTKSLQTEIRRLKDDSEILQQRRDYFEKIKVATVTQTPSEGTTLPNAEQWSGFISLYSNGLTEILDQARAIDIEREKVQERLNFVQREINDLRASGARNVQNVTVRLEVAEAGTIDLKVAYTVAEASWNPTYDVRVSSADKSIVLGYAAMVRQSTGEDWNGVNLTLSTARPAVGGNVPELSPWVVGERPKVLQRGRAESEVLSAMPMAADEAGTAMKSRALTTPNATVQAGLTSATFSIPYPAVIPADNAPHKVGVASHSIDGKLTHITVPKLAELAFLRAKVANTTELVLMPGPINLFLDQTFVARSYLGTTMPGEKFDLDLGVDDGVSVKRKLVNRLTENTGLISRKQHITYDLQITIKNNRAVAHEITVKDQIPVSRHEDVVVTTTAPAAGVAKTDEDGTITWMVTLGPGEEKKLPIKFSVEHPTDFPVFGLE